MNFGDRVLIPESFPFSGNYLEMRCFGNYMENILPAILYRLLELSEERVNKVQMVNPATEVLDRLVTGREERACLERLKGQFSTHTTDKSQLLSELNTCSQALIQKYQINPNNPKAYTALCSKGHFTLDVPYLGGILERNGTVEVNFTQHRGALFLLYKTFTWDSFVDFNCGHFGVKFVYYKVIQEVARQCTVSEEEILKYGITCPDCGDPIEPELLQRCRESFKQDGAPTVKDTKEELCFKCKTPKGARHSDVCIAHKLCQNCLLKQVLMCDYMLAPCCNTFLDPKKLQELTSFITANPQLSHFTSRVSHLKRITYFKPKTIHCNKCGEIFISYYPENDMCQPCTNPQNPSRFDARVFRPTTAAKPPTYQAYNEAQKQVPRVQRELQKPAVQGHFMQGELGFDLQVGVQKEQRGTQASDNLSVSSPGVRRNSGNYPPGSVPQEDPLRPQGPAFKKADSAEEGMLHTSSQSMFRLRDPKYTAQARAMSPNQPQKPAAQGFFMQGEVGTGLQGVAPKEQRDIKIPGIQASENLSASNPGVRQKGGNYPPARVFQEDPLHPRGQNLKKANPAEKAAGIQASENLSVSSPGVRPTAGNYPSASVSQEDLPPGPTFKKTNSAEEDMYTSSQSMSRIRDPKINVQVRGITPTPKRSEVLPTGARGKVPPVVRPDETEETKEVVPAQKAGIKAGCKTKDVQMPDVKSHTHQNLSNRCKTCQSEFTGSDADFQCPNACQCKLCGAQNVISLNDEICIYCRTYFGSEALKRTKQEFTQCHVCELAMGVEDIVPEAPCKVCKRCIVIANEKRKNTARCIGDNRVFSITKEAFEVLLRKKQAAPSACCSFNPSAIRGATQLHCGHFVCPRHAKVLRQCRECHIQIVTHY